MKTKPTRPGDEAAGRAIVGSRQTESAEEVEGTEERWDDGGSTGLVGAGWPALLDGASVSGRSWHNGRAPAIDLPATRTSRYCDGSL
jgi:hypothetical protein